MLACTHAGLRLAARVDPPAKVPKDKPYLALYSEAFTREHPDHVAEDILVARQNPQPPHAGKMQADGVVLDFLREVDERR